MKGLTLLLSFLAFYILSGCNHTKKLTDKNQSVSKGFNASAWRVLEERSKDSAGETADNSVIEINSENDYVKISNTKEIFGVDSCTGNQVLQSRETNTTEKGNKKTNKKQTSNTNQTSNLKESENAKTALDTKTTTQDKIINTHKVVEKSKWPLWVYIVSGLVVIGAAIWVYRNLKSNIL